MANGKNARNERRDAIIQASALLFERVGYHMTSMQMIADAVGLGKPTLYHYFTKKSEILYQMHQGLITQLMQSMSSHEQENPSADQLLRLICRDTIRFIKEHPGYIRAFFEHYSDLDPEYKETVRKQRLDYLQMISDIISKGISEKLFESRDPQISALVFLGICNWTYQWLPFQKDLDIDQLSVTLSDVFLNGMLTR